MGEADLMDLLRQAGQQGPSESWSWGQGGSWIRNSWNSWEWQRSDSWSWRSESWGWHERAGGDGDGEGDSTQEGDGEHWEGDASTSVWRPTAYQRVAPRGTHGHRRWRRRSMD